ncbi:PREDICTED: protein spartin isoform X2 [Drosophila arizonae]|uniref:Protein spartin isoform X2 n=1 Tax=Drosophila arizonae TaxID=7263 RepID=A0ABM1Q651_DROAR|nr:PREDICTED: protein spartin isoform X2 [Drosophila arizonae]
MAKHTDKALCAMSTDKEFLEAYERIKLSYKAAMTQVDIALCHDKMESGEEAVAAYEQALLVIEETFAIPVGLPDNIDAVQQQWNDACAIIQKLKSAKMDLSYRLNVLKSSQLPIDDTAAEAQEHEQFDGASTSKRPLLAENPSIFYDRLNPCGKPRTYKELATGLRELLGSHDSQAQLDELFQAQVKLYRIESSGQVITLTGSSKMSLIMCSVVGKWAHLNGSYFIQCDMPREADNKEAGTPVWLYPLIPNVTNCYCTEYGAFILPDMEIEQAGNAFGLMLVKPQRPLSTSAGESEEEQMADLQQFFLDLLEAVLADTVEQLPSPRSQRAASTAPEQVSKHIVCAADFIARNLVKGAEKTGGYMLRATPYLMSKMKPAAADEATQVPSSVQTGVEVAQKVTQAAAGLTGWIAGKVGTAAVAVGGYLAPHVQTQGSKLLQKGFGYDSSNADSTMEGAMTIAAGAVEGFTTVFDGFEKSAKILGNSLSENSVKIIEHKYGSSAGNLASETFDTVGNAFVISQNVNYITPKGLAKKLVKKTGEAVVVDLRRSESHYINAGALYPDLRALKE